MPSINDVFNQLVDANTKLQQIHNDLGNVSNATNQVATNIGIGFANISQGLFNLIKLQTFANQALFDLCVDDRTIICILEKISKQTCELFNEAHTQTLLQTSMQESITLLSELYETTHSDAALENSRLQKLHEEVLACCPPEPLPPPCLYEPCPAPPELGEPPVANYQPLKPDRTG